MTRTIRIDIEKCSQYVIKWKSQDKTKKKEGLENGIVEKLFLFNRKNVWKNIYEN